MHYMVRPSARRSLRGLGGAFDLAATVVPGDTTFNASASTTTSVSAANMAYATIAPLTLAQPSPLTVTGHLTKTLDYALSDAPAGSKPLGPDHGYTPVADFSVTGPGPTPIADATGTVAASDAVAEAHDDALDPTANGKYDGALDPGNVTVEDASLAPAARASAPRAGVPLWAWIVGGAVVVGGVMLVLRPR